MSTTGDRSRPERMRPAVLGTGIFMVLCCALGPGIVGVLGGAAIGGFAGITVGCLLATVVGTALYWRTRKRTGC